MSLDDIMMSDLGVMSGAKNYIEWLYSEVAPYLSGHILEIGSGIGNYTARLLEQGPVTAVEPMPEAAGILRSRFGGNPRFEVYEGGINDAYWDSGDKRNRFDTAVCLNVLEHIEDDLFACRMVNGVLRPGGHFCVIVPALPFLYGPTDAAVGHFRRYRRSQLETVLKNAEFRIVRLAYMNMVGVAGWYVTNKLLRQNSQSSDQVRFFDRVVVPVSRVFESLVPVPFGMSLVAIAQKREDPKE